MTDLALKHPRQLNQIRQMVVAQAGLNAQAYSAKWLELGSKADDDPMTWDYPLAASQEIAEFLNSWGYSWWVTKTWPMTEPIDRQNCVTELVDAWHFIMSQALIEDSGDTERATMALLTGYNAAQNFEIKTGHRNVVNYAKELMSSLTNWAGAPMETTEIYAQFFRLLLSTGSSMDHFHARYSAKLQLNIFRALNGYKDKPRTYVKDWEPGKEDNYFLAEWIDYAYGEYQAGVGDLPTDIEVMQWIAFNYQAKTQNKAVVPAIAEGETA